MGWDTQAATGESALEQQFRGHLDRDWDEWNRDHVFADAGAVPAGATKAWLRRQKLNYRGIGERRALRHVIAANVDQQFLEEMGALADLERLELEWPTTARDLTPLLGLKKLAFLSIDTPRQIEDFAPLLDLAALRTLIITDAKKMADLGWLAGAHHLEVIGVEGGMWSPYTIPRLTPLAGLRSLRAFLGVSTKLADQSLSPLASCPNLEFLSIARVAPRAEFEALKAARPDLVCSWFRPEMWGA